MIEAIVIIFDTFRTRGSEKWQKVHFRTFWPLLWPKSTKSIFAPSLAHGFGQKYQLFSVKMAKMGYFQVLTKRPKRPKKPMGKPEAILENVTKRPKICRTRKFTRARVENGNF